MTDEIKTDATKALADVKGVIADVDKDAAKVEAAEVSASGWVKTHVAWVIGLGCALVGFLAGYLAHVR
jgi:hypothetical protein